MAYENEHYRALKCKLDDYQTAVRWADQARTLRSMKYADSIDVTGQGRIHDRPQTGRLSSSIKDEVLEFAAMKCEDMCLRILQEPKPDFDIRKACSE